MLALNEDVDFKDWQKGHLKSILHYCRNLQQSRKTPDKFIPLYGTITDVI